MSFRVALMALAVAQPFLAVPAHADTPALWSFNEQTVMMLSDDPVLRMQAGLAGCLGTPEGPGTAAETVALFGFFEWHASTWGGLTELDHESTIALVADDNSFCEVSDPDVGTDAATEAVRAIFAEAEITDWVEEQTAGGCTTFTGRDGRVIEVSSGGNDPTCGKFDHSAIRVWNTAIIQ